MGSGGADEDEEFINLFATTVMPAIVSSVYLGDNACTELCPDAWVVGATDGGLANEIKLFPFNMPPTWQSSLPLALSQVSPAHQLDDMTQSIQAGFANAPSHCNKVTLPPIQLPQPPLMHPQAPPPVFEEEMYLHVSDPGLLQALDAIVVQDAIDPVLYRVTASSREKLALTVQILNKMFTALPRCWALDISCAWGLATTMWAESVFKLLGASYYKGATVMQMQNVQAYDMFLSKLNRSALPPPFAVRTDGSELADMLQLMTCANEKLLFHGTSSNNLEAIVHQGIDPRVGNASGLFGKGSYFAEDIQKAKNYGDVVLVCIVALGHVWTQTSHSREFTRPPCINQPCQMKCSHQLHDSLCGAIPGQYREFVVFEQHCAYPLFAVQTRDLPQR